MKKYFLSLQLVIVFALGVSTLALARDVEYFRQLDPSKYEISLLTAGRGKQFYALGGHSLLKVYETKTKNPPSMRKQNTPVRI